MGTGMKQKTFLDEALEEAKDILTDLVEELREEFPSDSDQEEEVMDKAMRSMRSENVRWWE